MYNFRSHERLKSHIMTIINFPGGAGGNWLASVLKCDPMPASPIVYWHNHTNFKIDSTFKMVHSLKDDYDILYSGSYYFNFYLNVLLKSYQIDRNFQSGYQNKFDQMFEVARWLYDWATIHGTKTADLVFDDLITDHLTFHKNVIKIQQSHDLHTIDLNEFEMRREKFFETCVRSDDVFGNFDNMTFVVFVLAWLEQADWFPHDDTHFIMNDPNNQHLCKKFAADHYDMCRGIQNQVFPSGKQCPDFLQ